MSEQAVRSRSTYRHGDLRRALVEAGFAMARAGGPGAIVLREATRTAGVSPNAAYRHFADRNALMLAVSGVAQGLAADVMEQTLAQLPASGDPATDARARLRAVGRAYLRFARDEPGLFRTAFSVPEDMARAFAPDKAGESGRTPFQILGAVLDELVEAGVLPPERRPNAEFLAWSSVHGLGMLVIDGPLYGLTDDLIERTTEHLLDMVDRGL
ncbi:TetR/AcrR family transcriptional regulator [Herbiconiux sp. SYSU D00978]|uniref:TetR/AcrR family transcriptional regulator n=1 Tax=Herbiconiux sp. SYSU D00978 TaxID=2812562 RepID=UPI001F615469|nr:TetR-like C-terminal domain-containing protein [Herbiconiux sp. SYSU D00978]